MALNLTNLWRKAVNYLQYSNPITAAPKIVNGVAKIVSSPEVQQWAVNFMWWINDTMNFPAYAVGKVWAYLSPQWSTAQKRFDLLAKSARQASDVWQDRTSAEYIVGRMAPGVAVIAAAPAAWAVTLPEYLWIEAAWLSTLAAPLDLENSVEYWRQQQLAQQRNLQARTSIVNALKQMRDNWEIYTNPAKTQQLIDLYNKIK